jgi:hypothetical protein
MRNVTLYTSVPPDLIRQAQLEDYGASYQAECINSWRQAGFRVVSLNSDCEIEGLLKRGYDIEFMSNGSSQSRTKMESFFSVVLASGDDVAGIINADCFLMSPGVAIDNLLTATVGSIVLLERLNIDPTTMRATGSSNFGFDAFFFDTRFVAKIDYGNEWTIGEPVWDYWFPLAMHIAGATLKAPTSPIIVHLNHEQQWAIGDSNAKGIKLLRHLLSLESEGRLPTAMSRQIRKFKLQERSREIDEDSFWRCFIPWLRNYPQTFTLCASGSPGDFLCRMLAGMAASQESSLRHQLNAVTLGYWLQAKRRALARAKTGALHRLHLLSLPKTSEDVDRR